MTRDRKEKQKVGGGGNEESDAPFILIANQKLVHYV